MKMDEMVTKFEREGFKVEKSYCHTRKAYLFIITKAGNSLSGHFVYPEGLSPKDRDAEQRNFIDNLICRFEMCYEPSKHAVLMSDELGKGLIEGLRWDHADSKPLATNCKSTLTSSGIEIRGDVMDEFWKEFEKIRRPVYNFSCPSITVTPIYKIKDVIFNYPATIVFWEDGTKTVVKCQGDDVYDPEKGLAMAFCKKALGNKGNYCNIFHKWLKKYEKPSPWFMVSAEEAASNLKKLAKAASKFSRNLKCKSKDALVQQAYDCLVKDNDHDAAVGYLGEYLDD